MTIAIVVPGAIVRRVMAACAVTVVVFGATVVAQETGGRIAGIVADATDIPVARARITLHGPAERELRAGDDGRFVIERLADGAYTITATPEGFAPSADASTSSTATAQKLL
jgi:hypothetical protein